MRNMMRRGLALGCMATLIGSSLSACTALTQPDGSGVSDPPALTEPSSTLGSPLLWADGSSIAVTAHKLDLARLVTAGTDYTKYSSTESLTTGPKAFASLGVNASGALAGVWGTRQNDEHFMETGQLMEPESMRMGLHTSASFAPFTRAEAPRSAYVPQTVSSGIVTAEGTIWSELTEDNSGHSGWKILGVSPGSTQVRVLASRPRTQSPEEELYFASLRVTALVDGRVYWHIARQSVDADYPAYQMLSVDFANPGTPREEAFQTDVSSPWKRGVVAANLEPNDAEAMTAQALTSYQPGAAPQEILRLERGRSDESGLKLLGSDDRGLSVAHDDDLYFIDPETRSAQMVRGPYRSEVVGLASCGSRVSWIFREPDAQKLPTERYVFDRDSATLQILRGKATMAGSGSCAGDFISWSEIGQVDAGNGMEMWDVVTRWAP